MLFSIPCHYWPSWFNMAFSPACTESTQWYHVRDWPCIENCFGHSSKAGFKIDCWLLVGPLITINLKPFQSGFQAVLSEATFRLTDYGYDTGIKVITSHEHLGKFSKPSDWSKIENSGNKISFFFWKISFWFFCKRKKANGWIKMIYHLNWVDQLISSTNEIWKWQFR